MIDEPLRLRAKDRLGPYGPGLAHEALEHGELEVEPAVARWESSHGSVEAHRVTLRIPDEIRERLLASPAAQDALTAAVAAALAERGLTSLYDLRLSVPQESLHEKARGPYR